MKRYELTDTRPTAYFPAYRMVEDADGEYVLYSEAAARIEELGWLVECLDYHNSGWACLLSADAALSVVDTLQAARAAVEEGQE